jgi:hypothetical protein
LVAVVAQALTAGRLLLLLTITLITTRTTEGGEAAVPDRGRGTEMVVVEKGATKGALLPVVITEGLESLFPRLRLSQEQLLLTLVAVIVIVTAVTLVQAIVIASQSILVALVALGAPLLLLVVQLLVHPVETTETRSVAAVAVAMVRERETVTATRTAGVVLQALLALPQLVRRFCLPLLPVVPLLLPLMPLLVLTLTPIRTLLPVFWTERTTLPLR